MGQKSNILTIRKKNRVGLVLENSRIWVTIFKILENLGRLLFLKNVLLVNYFGNINGNYFHISLLLYYTTKKILYFKKKFLKTKKKKIFCFQQSFTISNELFNRVLNIYNLTSYRVSVKTLNFLIKKSVLNFFFTKLKKYRFNIFSRRLFFFYDFLKLTSLFLEGYIELEYYIQIWSRIFKNISKRLHGKFISFAKTTFLAFMELQLVIKKPKYDFLGVKFSIQGRLRAKDRASSKLIQVGSVSSQSVALPVEYSSCHIYTLYGTFGVKIWTLKKKLDYDVKASKTKIQKISKG